MTIDGRIIHLPKRSLSEKYWFAVDQPKDKTEGRLKIADLISYIENNIDISSTVTFTLSHTSTDYDKFVTYDSTGKVLYYRTGAEVITDLSLDSYYLRLDGTNDPVTGNITYADDVYQYFGTSSNGGYVYSTTLGGGTLATVFGANVVSEINASHYYLNDEAGNLKIELNSSQAAGQRIWFHDSTYVGGSLVVSNLLTASIANASSEYGKFLVTDTGVVEYRTTTEVLAELGLTDLATMFELDVSDTINALYPLNIASLRILPDSGVVTIAQQDVTSDSNYGDDIAIQFVVGGFKAKLGTYADGAGGTYSNYFDFDTAALSTVKSIQFDITGLSHAHSEGSVWWSEDDKTLNLDTEISDTVIQVGQEVVIRCTNKTGSLIPNGSAVFVNGAQGQRPTIALALATSRTTMDTLIGVATADIADNATSYVTILGKVRDVDTSAFVEAEILYVSSTVAGAFTNVRPVAPNIIGAIGMVLYSHATEGVIGVKPTLFPTIDQISEVHTPAVKLDKAILVWNNASGYYEHRLGVATDISDFDTEVSNNTDVVANTAAKHAALTIGTANGLSLATQALSLALSSTSTTGALSDTDWDTFNDKAPIASPTFTGTVTTPIIKITTGAASGYYLQSDATGVASWAAIAVAYKGTWDASSNTPTLADGVGTAGDWYRCVVAGTVDFGAGNITFAIGDDAYYSGTVWQMVPGAGYTLQTASATVLGGIKIGFGLLMTSDVCSVNNIPNLTGPITSSGLATSIASQTGTGTKFVVDTSPTIVTPTIASFVNSTHDHADAAGGGVLSTSDITEGTSLYYTDERVDDRAAALIQDGTGLAWTYVDAAGTLTGNVSLTVFDTDDLAEAGNLYYTQARFDSAFTAKDTDDLSEGSSNLYYTDARVMTKIVSMGTANYVPIFSAAGLTDSVINQSTAKIIITGTLGVGIDPAAWTAWLAGATRIDNSLTIYSDEVGKTDHKIVFDASDGDNLRIYSYDNGGAAFLPVIIGGSADATSGLTIAFDAVDADLDASGFIVDGNLRATVANAITDTDKFVVDDSGELKYRTATEMLSDLGITDTATMFTLGDDDVIYPLYPLGIASLYILPDTGSLTIANMDVTSDSGYGDQHNYKFTIASNSLIDIGLYADGAGGYYGKYINLNTDTVVSDTLTVSSITNASTDLDKFLVSNSGVIEYRTGTEVLSDIGAQATLSPSALTKSDDTNVTLALGGTPSTALLEAVSLTLGWTGMLSISRGGTNAGSVLTNDRVMVSSAGSIVESPTITTTELSLLNGIVSMSTGAGDNDKFVSQGYVDDSIAAISTTLGGLTDVTITTVTDDEILQYDSGSALWINQTFTEAGIQSTITPAALTKTDDTNVTLTLGGSHATALLSAASLTLGWAGTLADGRIASSTDWNTAYTHSQLTSGNPHSVTKTDIGLDNVDNISLLTWAGTTNITILGTIATGVWNGTAITDSYIATSSNWNTAYAHITADGSSHTYIDQDVTTTADPTFAGINISSPNLYKYAGNDLFKNAGDANNYGAIQYMGTSVSTAGTMNSTTGTPTNTNRLNYEGYFYATKLYVGSTEVVPGELNLANDEWLTSEDHNGNEQNLFKVSTADTMRTGLPIEISSLYILPDSGIVTIANQDVTSDSSYGDEITFQLVIGGQFVFKTGAYADGAGGVYSSFTTIEGNITADNLSGTNTGDQDLSGYSLTTHEHDSRYLKLDTSNDPLTSDLTIDKDDGYIGTFTTVHSDGFYFPLSSFDRSRGSLASPTIVANGDYLGMFRARGYDGNDYVVNGAYFYFQVDGTPAAERIPTKIVFATALGAVDNDIATAMTIGKDKSLVVVGDISGNNLSGTNTDDVTLAGSLNYITISGQVITRNAIDLTADVSGLLPDGNIASASYWDSKQAGLTFGIDDGNTVIISSSTVISTDYARFTATGLEGRSVTELVGDIGLDNVDNISLLTWSGSTNITILGTIAAGINIATGQTYRINGDTIITASASFDDTKDALGASMKAIKDYGDINWGGVITDHALLSNLNSTSYYHLTQSNHSDLTGSGNTSLHYHSADRARAGHTGTQLASTISDFDTEVSNNSSVTTNTAKTSFPGFGLDHVTAAYGDHTHSAYAPLAAYAQHTEGISIVNSSPGNTVFYVRPNAGQTANIVNVRNKANTASHFVIDSLGYITLSAGTDINEFSTDGTMAGSSNNAVPTEAAVVTYVGTQVGFSTGDTHTWTANQTFNDSVKLNLGTGSDYSIYSNGTFFSIEDTGGDRFIINSSYTAQVSPDGTNLLSCNDRTPITVTGLPTTTAGLSAGDVYSNGGVLTIV